MKRFTFYTIHNPTSRELGGAAISQLKYVREEYDRAYLATRNAIKFKIARTDKQDKWDWIFWAKIPSERLPGLYYDVICTALLDKDDTNFKDADIKIWCNTPSFTFNYTYVCNLKNWVAMRNGKLVKEKLLPEWLIPKCSKKALVDRPKIRNPLEIWHLEKYVVLLRRHIFTSGYLNIKYIMRDLDPNLSQEEIFNQVDSQEEKLIQARAQKRRDTGELIDNNTESAEL